MESSSQMAHPSQAAPNDASISGMMRMIESDEPESSMATELRKSVPSDMPITTGPQDVTKKREKNRVAAAASRARKKEYVQNLEKAIHVLTTEKLELQVKVATLTNQLWEQSIKIDDLEKQLAEAKGLRKPDDQEMNALTQFPAQTEDASQPTEQQPQQPQEGQMIGGEN